MPSNKWEVYQCPVTGRFLDPFRVLAALRQQAGKELNSLAAKVDTDPTAALKMAGAARVAFGLPPVSSTTGEGTPDAVILEMVEKFAEYVKGKGPGAGSWRSWSLPSVALPPSSAPTTSLPSRSTEIVLPHNDPDNYPRLSQSR